MTNTNRWIIYLFDRRNRLAIHNVIQYYTKLRNRKSESQ